LDVDYACMSNCGCKGTLDKSRAIHMCDTG